MASRFIVPFNRSGADPLLSIYREMNRMFDDVFSGASSTQGSTQGALMAMPSLDVQEKGDEFGVSVELPGVKREDVDVRIDRDMLTISGEKKVDEDRNQSNFHVMERSYGRFSRSMQLPFMPDPSQASADFEHGVLKIRLKRNAQQESSHRIEVRSNQDTNKQLGQEAGHEAARQGASGSAAAGRPAQPAPGRSGDGAGQGGGAQASSAATAR
jgi:HSP20 family protein